MIDTFWTRWRVRQLCKGDKSLLGRWLDDYAGWLYGRVWYRCGRDSGVAERLLSELFLRAAGHLSAFTNQPLAMSEWLLGFLNPQTGGSSSGCPCSDVSLKHQIQMLTTQALVEESQGWKPLLAASQQALVLLSRDEQEALVCRYMRLEPLGHIAGNYRMDLQQLQELLYRARHSFRRTLESLGGIANLDASQPVQAGLDILETNLEKLLACLGPKPMISSAVLERLRSDVHRVIDEQRANSEHWITPARVISFIVVGIIVLLGGLIMSLSSHPDQAISPADTQPRKPSAIETTKLPKPIDAGEELKQTFELGEQKNIAGLLGVLRSGSYPSQLAAAHYLGKWGDKTAIDTLDQASQKWYSTDPLETNPFAEAIRAIEERTKIRLQLEQELQKLKAKQAEEAAKKLSAMPKEPSHSATREPKIKEPNLPSHLPVEPNVIPTPSVIEPNQPQLTSVPAGGDSAADAQPLNPVQDMPAEPNIVLITSPSEPNLPVLEAIF